MNKRTILIAILISFLIAILFLPVSPMLQKTPPRDSGIFLYVASEMLEGKVLYQQIWDHKPPVVFLINALGLWLSSGSVWGVWILQYLFITIASILALVVLSDALGLFAASIGIAGSIFTLHQVLHGGNYTEEYAILFQIAALFCFYWGVKHKDRFWYAILTGGFVALSFFTRQNLISIGIGILLFLIISWLFNKNKHTIKFLLWTVISFIGVSGVICLTFIINGTLSEFWDAAFYYNSVYSQLGLLERLKSVFDEFEFLMTYPGFVFGLVAWLVGFVCLIYYHSNRIIQWVESLWFRRSLILTGILIIIIGVGGELIQPDSQFGFGLLQIMMTIIGLGLLIGGVLLTSQKVREAIKTVFVGHDPSKSDGVVTVLSIAVISFPVDIIFVSLSARNYLHYYITFIPVLMVLVSFLSYFVSERLTSSTSKKQSWAFGCAILIVTMIVPLISLPFQYKPAEDQQITETVAFIKNNTEDTDPILIWGAEPIVYFYSGRQTVTRYPHVYPFYLDHESTGPRLKELDTGIKDQIPSLIIDTRNVDTPFIDRSESNQLSVPENVQDDMQISIFEYICSHYRYITVIGPQQWRVYQYQGVQ